MLKFLEEYADFFVYPVLLVYLLCSDLGRMTAFPLMWAGLFVLGWFTWTFAEYWVHRSLLHGAFWMGIHERHHDHPKEITRFPLWQIPSYFLAIYLVVWVIAGTWTTAVFSGIILGWLCFFMTHHALHHFPIVLQSFAIRHNAHHKLTHMNYGVTVDWWDRVFGTFRPAKRG